MVHVDNQVVELSGDFADPGKDLEIDIVREGKIGILVIHQTLDYCRDHWQAMRPSLERETVHMLHFNLIIGGNQEFVERLQYSAPQRDFGHLRDWTKQIDTSIKIVRTQARRQPVVIATDRSEEQTSELQSL